MIGNVRKKQLALGCNVLLDLALECEFAHEFRRFLQSAGCSLLISPTVVQEMVFASLRELEPQRSIAEKTLQNALAWSIQPFTLTPADQEIAQQFALRLRQGGLLPAMEVNDALILSESGLAEIAILATTDYRLGDIDRDPLVIAYNIFRLSPVLPIHPNRLFRLMQ